MLLRLILLICSLTANAMENRYDNPNAEITTEIQDNSNNDMTKLIDTEDKMYFTPSVDIYVSNANKSDNESESSDEMPPLEDSNGNIFNPQNIIQKDYIENQKEETNVAETMFIHESDDKILSNDNTSNLIENENKIECETEPLMEQVNHLIEANQVMPEILHLIETIFEDLPNALAVQIFQTIKPNKNLTPEEAMTIGMKSVKQARKTMTWTLAVQDLIKEKMEYLFQYDDAKEYLTKKYPEFDVDLVDIMNFDQADYRFLTKNVSMGDLYSLTWILQFLLDVDVSNMAKKLCPNVSQFIPADTNQKFAKFSLDSKLLKTNEDVNGPPKDVEITGDAMKNIMKMVKDLVQMNVKEIPDQISLKKSRDLLQAISKYTKDIYSKSEENSPHHIFADIVLQNVGASLYDDGRSFKKQWRLVVQQIKHAVRTGTLWKGSDYLKHNLLMPTSMGWEQIDPLIIDAVCDINREVMNLMEIVTNDSGLFNDVLKLQMDDCSKYDQNLDALWQNVVDKKNALGKSRERKVLIRMKKLLKKKESEKRCKLCSRRKNRDQKFCNIC